MLDEVDELLLEFEAVVEQPANKNAESTAALAHKIDFFIIIPLSIPSKCDLIHTNVLYIYLTNVTITNIKTACIGNLRIFFD
ncbi:hypothetical protein LCB40_11570 [Lactobacillus corticis]|uniref:Uncharacterized protein n=1 Tax=Lactobacillus corticis TaxID=2201249 RepID=A0A916QJ93_9LACO|nr:hypothetical protein LCB40_11570 [Lactobacillus corticis]